MCNIHKEYSKKVLSIYLCAYVNVRLRRKGEIKGRAKSNNFPKLTKRNWATDSRRLSNPTQDEYKQNHTEEH